MNRIEILEPRWHDRTILVADWKIGRENQIVIKNHNFPEPFYMEGDKLKSYPVQMVKTKGGDNKVPMRVVPLNDLTTDLVLADL